MRLVGALDAAAHQLSRLERHDEAHAAVSEELDLVAGLGPTKGPPRLLARAPGSCATVMASFGEVLASLETSRSSMVMWAAVTTTEPEGVVELAEALGGHAHRLRQLPAADAAPHVADLLGLCQLLGPDAPADSRMELGITLSAIAQKLSKAALTGAALTGAALTGATPDQQDSELAAAALALHLAAVALYRPSPDAVSADSARELSRMLYSKAWALSEAGRHDEAHRAAEEAVAVLRIPGAAPGSDWSLRSDVAWALRSQAELLRDAGQPGRAVAPATEAAEILQQICDELEEESGLPPRSRCTTKTSSTCCGCWPAAWPMTASWRPRWPRPSAPSCW